MNEYLKKLYDWISTKDPNFSSKLSIDEFVSKMETDSDYNSRIFNWINTKDPMFSTKLPENEFQEKTLKKKEEPVDSTSPEVATESTSQPQEDLGLSESGQDLSDRVAGIKEYFERRDLSAQDVESDINIQAAIASGVISEQDLIDAGYKLPQPLKDEGYKQFGEQISTLSATSPMMAQKAKDKITALRKKTDQELDFTVSQQKLGVPYAFEQSASGDTFVDDVYSSSMLASMNINPNDFDGFLEEKGFKKDFMDKKERGLFENSYLAGGDPELSFEIEKMRMLNLYVTEQLQRDINWQKIQEQKRTGIDPDFVGKKFRPSANNIDTRKLTEYIETEMPYLSQKLKERDAKNRETYKKYIDGEMGVGNFLSTIVEEGWQGFSDRVGEFSASTYDILGMDNVADALRLASDVDKVTRPDRLTYGFASGKAIEHNGRKYLVDSNNQVYDTESKIVVTQFLSPLEYKSIVDKAKEFGYNDQTFSPVGTAYQVSNVVGDLVVQLALTRGAGTVTSAAGGLTRGLGVLGKTKDLLRAIPVSRSMGSAIIAQATLGASSGYEKTFKQARESGLSDAEARELASYSSQQMAVLYALTAPISPQTKATEAFSKMFGNLKNLSVKEAVEAYKKMGLEGARGVFTRYGNNILNFSGEGLKELVQENVQQAGEAFIVNKNVNEEAARNILKDTITLDEFVNTSIISFLAGGLMPAAGKAVSSSMSSVRKMLGFEGIDRLKALDYLSRNEKAVMQVLDDQISRGIYTVEAANDLISELNTYKEGVGKIPQDLDPEVALDIMGDIAKISELENKKEGLDPAFRQDIDDQIQSIRDNIRKKSKRDAVQEQEAGAVPDDQQAETVQEVEEGVRFTTEEKTEKVSDLLYRPVTLTKLGGSNLDTPVEGQMYVEGQQVVVEDENGNITEIGNVDEISDSTLEEMGIEQRAPEVTVESDGNLKFREQTLVPDRKGIKTNKRGEISRVVLRSPDGSQTVTLRGANAEEAAYQIMLKEAQSPEQEQRINELLEKDEEFQNELRQAEAAAKGKTDQDTEQAARGQEEKVDKNYSTTTIAIRTRPKNADEDVQIVTGIEAEAADRVIEKITNDGIKKGQTTQEILDRILPRFGFNDAEINGIRSFIDGKRSGETKTDFATYRKGRPAVEQEAAPDVQEAQEVISAEQLSTPETFTHQTRREDAIVNWANAGQLIGEREDINEFDSRVAKTIPEKGLKIGRNRWSPNFQKGGLYNDKIIKGVKFVVVNKNEQNFIPSDRFMNVDSFDQSKGISTLKPDARDISNFDLYSVNEDGTLTKRDWNEFKTKDAEEASGSKESKAYVAELKRTKESDPGTYWSVSEVSDQDAAEGTVINTKDGGALVKKNGDIVGVFKKLGSKAKGVAQDLLKKAVEAGGTKLDNFVTGAKGVRLQEAYEKAGFRVVARTPFNRASAPDGWTEADGTPDVVAMVYDPEGKIDIEEKTFTDPKNGYDQMIAYRDSVLEGQKKSGIDRLKDIFKAPNQKAQIEAAEGALSKLAPDVKIVVHEDEDSYAEATGEKGRKQKSAGEYNAKTKTIHINSTKANARTVAHEAFHAILLNIIGTDAEVQRITKAMMKAVAKSASPELKAALDRFAANYDENIQNEERLAELIGIMASQYKTLDRPSRNVIKRWLDRLVKMFGLKPFTDSEVIDVLNTISRKLQTGEAITKEDVSPIAQAEVESRAGRMSRKQMQDLFLSEDKPNLKSTKDVAKFLDGWSKESAVFDQDVKNIPDSQIEDRFVDHLTLELAAWEKVRKDEYISFYDDDIVKNTNPTLQSYAEKEYGRSLTDTEVKLYHLVSAFASPSANPEMDSWKGFDIFDRFMKTGELSGYSDKIATVWETLPGGRRVDTGVPRKDEKGMPVRSKVTPAYSQTGLDKFNLLLEKMGGDMDKAMEWITSEHSYSEIAEMFGYPEKGPKALNENEYMTKQDGGLGVFGMTGAKLGSYILNRFGNFSTVTKDMWYARTMARLSGQDLVAVNAATKKEGAIKTPWTESTKEGRRMRAIADRAFKRVGEIFNTSPAMIQERIWDFEKRLYEMLGANEDAAYTSDGLKKGIERAAERETRKQIPGVDPYDIVKRGREEGISDQDIRAFLDQEGYTEFEIPSRTTVDELQESSESELAAKVKKKNARFISRMIREHILDRQTRVKDLIKGIGSKEAGRAANLLVTKAGGTGYANFRFKKADKDIYGSLSENDIKDLDKIIYAQRIIAINEKREQAGKNKYKGAKGYNETAARRDINDAKRRLGDDKFNDLNSRAKRYFKEFDQNLDRAFEEGIMSEDAYNNFKGVEYSPIRTIKYLVPDDYDGATVDRMTNITGMNQEMIKRLSDENVNNVIMDSRWLLMTAIAMTEGRVFENRMLNAFNDAVENATEEQKEQMSENVLDNPMVGRTKKGKPVYKYDKVTVPPGFTTIEFIKDGQKRNIVIRKTYASQLLDIKTQPGLMEKGVVKLTGVNVLRFLATSGNPLFIVGNTAVDFANILFLSDVYGKNKFFGGAKLAFDAASTFTRKVVSDAAAKLNISKKMAFDRMYAEFMEHGGAMDYLSMDGIKAISGIKGKGMLQKGSLGLMRGIGGVLSYLGESSEITFRLAVFEKSKQNQIKQFKKDNGRDPNKEEMEDIMFEAAREARETIDFAQGGSTIKAADRMLPYLNAATQGFRKGFDYALNNPGKFASSAVQAMMMAGSVAALSLFNLFRGMDEEDEERVLDILNSVSEYEKANYHIIFTGKKNEEGEFEYYRVKKLPTISAFSTMAEQMVIKSILKEKGVKYDVDGKAMSRAVDNAIPIIPVAEIDRIVRGEKSKSGAPMIVDVPMKILNRNPLLAGVLSYSYNYDHFYGTPIFNAPRNYKIDETAEGVYDDRVNQIYKDLAPYFNMSPKRTKAMVEKIVTSETTNPIVGLLYSGYDVVAKDDTTVGEEIDKAMENLKKNATKKTTRYTNKNLLRYEQRDEAEREEIGIETKKYLAEQKVYSQIRKRYVDDKGTMDNDEFVDMIKDNFDRYDWKKYAKKYRAYIRNMNVDKSILDIVFEDTPEVQAYLIYKKFGDSFEEDEIEMIRDVYRSARRKFSKKGMFIYRSKYAK